MTSARMGLRVEETSIFWDRFWSDESGASSAEYAVILAVVGSALVFSVILLGGALATAINDATTCLNTMGNTCN